MEPLPPEFYGILLLGLAVLLVALVGVVLILRRIRRNLDDLETHLERLEERADSVADDLPDDLPDDRRNGDA